ncbi:MAG TPA: TPM domain-containing protein, partial [Terriglobales bacterium]|nr:TPM domain-containing protein [Terriglobales bacterium]
GVVPPAAGSRHTNANSRIKRHLGQLPTKASCEVRQTARFSFPQWLIRLAGICFAVLTLSAAQLPGALADPTLPALSGRVVDAAHILGDQAKTRLSDDLRIYEAQTGTQIVIVTLPALQGYSIEQWGLALLRGWQIGQRGKNNGVVIVLAPNDRQVRIETGYGAAEALSDADASAIIRRDMMPFFKRGDFVSGLIAGTKKIEAALVTEFPAIAPGETDRRDFWHRISIPIVLAIVSPLFLIFFLYLIIWSLRGEARFMSGSRTGRWRYNSWGNSSYRSYESLFDDSSPSSGGSFFGGGGSGGGGGASGSW